MWTWQYLVGHCNLQQKTHKYREAKFRITSERDRRWISILCTNPHEHFMVVAAECMAIKDNLKYRNFQLQPLQAHAIVRVTQIRRIFSSFLIFLFFSFFVIFLILNACISWFVGILLYSPISQVGRKSILLYGISPWITTNKLQG